MRRFGEIRRYRRRRDAVRDRQARPRHVRGAVRQCRDHPARRPRARHADHRSGTGPVSGRDRPALRPHRAGRRPCRGRCRNAADPAGAIARAAGGRGRSRRAHHARADPAPGQPDPGRRRRPGADRRRRRSATWRGCRISSTATASRIICSIPPTDKDAADLVARYATSRADLPLVVCPDGTVLRNPSETALADGDRHDCRARPARSCTTSPWSAAVRPGLPPRSMRHPKDCRSPCSTRAPIGGQAGASAQDRELSGLPDRHFRPGAGRPRLQPGAEVRRGDADPGLGQVARLLAQRRRASRLRPNADSLCARRSVVVASGARYRRPEIENLEKFEGRGVWYWASPIEARLCADQDVVAGRRRQFRRAGGGVPLGPCAKSLHDDPRRRPRRQHVALSDRAHRGDAEYRTAVQYRGRRARGQRRRLARAGALAQPPVAGEGTPSTSATCSCSSAPIPRPTGSTAAASCSTAAALS